MRFAFGEGQGRTSEFQAPVFSELAWGLSVLGTCWARVAFLSCCSCRSSCTVLHLLLKFQLLASPLPSLAAFGVLDFVHTPAPGSQAGRSCFERLSKAMLSCLLPAPCLEHTLIFLLSNGSSSSVQPGASLAAKCSAPLSFLGESGPRCSQLQHFSPLGSVYFFPGSWDGTFTCRFLACPGPA